MVTDLNATATQGFWIGTAYLLSSAAPMPFIAALSEIFGRPPCLLFCLALFTTGSVICCTAHSITVLLVGRSVQGIGGGGVFILTLVIMTDIVPLRYRPKYLGIM
jgi:MFS family permease